jgi:hypothetical protein
VSDPDPVTERFADLDYPGRRKPVNRERKVEVPEAAPWDARPLHYIVKGEKQEFFTIGHLASALGYSVQSIRAWEASGLLPRTPYRSPRPRKAATAKVNTKGKRLWTREQIVGIVQIAREEKVILNKVPPNPRFAKRVQQLFTALQSQP